MKRIMLDIPDCTCAISVAYVYMSKETGNVMIGNALITSGDDADVLHGEKPYILRQEDRGESEC